MDTIDFDKGIEPQEISNEDLLLFEGINSLFSVENIGTVRLSLLFDKEIDEKIIIEEKLEDRLNFWRNFLGCDIRLTLIEDERLGGYKKLSVDIIGLSTNPNIRNHILNTLVPYLESVGFSLTFIDPSSIKSFSKEEISKYSRFFSGDWYKNLDGEVLFKEMILYLENMLCFLMKKNEGINSISSDLENIGEENYGEITVLIGLMKKIEGIQLKSLISAYKKLQKFRSPMTQGIALLTEEIISKTETKETNKRLTSRTGKSLFSILKKDRKNNSTKDEISKLLDENLIDVYYRSFIENKELNLDKIVKNRYKNCISGKIFFDYNGTLNGSVSILKSITCNTIRTLLLSNEFFINDLIIEFKGISYVEFENMLERLYGIIRFLDTNKTSSPDEGLDEYIEKTDFNKLGEEEQYLLMEYLDIPNEGKTDNLYSLKSEGQNNPRFLNKKFKKLLSLLSPVNRIFKYHYIILLATETKNMVQLNKLLRQYRTNLTKISEIVDKSIIDQIIDSFPKTQENNKGPNGKQKNITNKGSKVRLSSLLGEINRKEKVEIMLGISPHKYTEIRKKIYDNISNIIRSRNSDDIEFIKQFLRILADIDLLVVEGIVETDSQGKTIEDYRWNFSQILGRTKSSEGQLYLKSKLFDRAGTNNKGNKHIQRQSRDSYIKEQSPLEKILGDISGREKVEIELGIGEDKYSENKKKIIENIPNILRYGNNDDINFIKQFLRILTDIDLLVVEGIKEKDESGKTIEDYRNDFSKILGKTKSAEGQKYLFSKLLNEFGIKEFKMIYGDEILVSGRKAVCEIFGFNFLKVRNPYKINVLSSKNELNLREINLIFENIFTTYSDDDILIHFGQCLLFELVVCEINKDNILKLITRKGEKTELYLSILKNILGIDDKLNINELLKTKDGGIKKIDELASTINNTKTVKGKTFLLECVLEKINEDELINFIKALDTESISIIQELLCISNGVDIFSIESDNFGVKKNSKEKMELIGRFGTNLGKRISSKILFGHLSIQDCYKLLKEIKRDSGKDILREVKGLSLDHNIFDDKFEIIFNQSNNNTVKELDNDTINLILEIMSKTTDYKTKEEIFNIFLKYPLFGEDNNISYSKTLDILFINKCIILLSIPFLRTTDFSYFLDNANVESMEMLIQLSKSNGLPFKITKDWKNTFNAFYCDRDIIETIIPYYKIFISLEYISFSNEIVEIIGKNRDPYKLQIICKRLKIVLEKFELSDLGIFRKAIFWQTLENMNNSIFSFITNGNDYNENLREVIDNSISVLDNKIKNYRDNGNSKKVNKLLKIRNIITNLGRNITFINFNAKTFTNPLVSDFLTKAGFIEFIILLIHQLRDNFKKSKYNETIEKGFIIRGITSIDIKKLAKSWKNNDHNINGVHRNIESHLRYNVFN